MKPIVLEDVDGLSDEETRKLSKKNLEFTCAGDSAANNRNEDYPKSKLTLQGLSQVENTNMSRKISNGGTCNRKNTQYDYKGRKRGSKANAWSIGAINKNWEISDELRSALPALAHKGRNTSNLQPDERFLQSTKLVVPKLKALHRGMNL